MKVVLLGSTGLVGSHVLDLLLQDERIEKVIAPVRKLLEKQHAKLESPLVNFENLPEDVNWWKVDAVICTLGTTIKDAGSEAAFYRVDHDYPIISAQIAIKNAVPVFIFNSAMGADKNSSFFYNRVKGQTEDDLIKMNFRSLVLVRPGLIGGNRKVYRSGEEIAKKILGLLHAFLPKRLRINNAEMIAHKILEVLFSHKSGLQIITSEQMALD